MCRKEGNIMDERFEIVRRFVGSKGLGKKNLSFEVCQLGKFFHQVEVRKF